ncbi:hypothetical protein SLS62_001795 [Diatrype stigma]|uniref:Uncharacterized protein n=1 Tax=Diatrype stigma TaxID=117547 RepID=A0AAN9UZW3_9PEZI
MASGSVSRIQFTNITDKETVYQRCLLVTGTCHDYPPPRAPGAEDFIAVKAKDALLQPLGQQNWPVWQGTFRCLVMLQPGANRVDFQLHHQGQVRTSARITVHCQPLLQLPPLHLAIMVAKDSPLLIDCPPAKRGAITTAHSTLDAAILKLRLAAYMWQALTAEDLRTKGLGRRSFRLDEEWGLDTTTMASMYPPLSSNSDNARGSDGDSSNDNTETRLPMGSVAKVHVVRSEKTVAELRDPDVAQQNHRARRRDELHTYFEQALKAHGHPFVGAARPVVAGLILDAHYSLAQDLIVGHAGLGRHNHKPGRGGAGAGAGGLSLGVFGSHTTYAWPRFLEEVPACLLDATPTGDTVGNDNGRCATMRGACFVGQGGLLHEVGAAFGAEGAAAGIMSRGYEKSWGRAFVAQKGGDDHDARWNLSEALSFLTQEQFRLPGDPALSRSQKDGKVQVHCILGQNDETLIEASCKAGLARIRFADPMGKVGWEVDFCRKTAAELQDEETAIKFGPAVFHLSFQQLEERLDRSKVWSLEVLGMNGSIRTEKNIWIFRADKAFIKVPGTSLVLSKRSVGSPARDKDQQYWRWAVLLKRKHRQGAGMGLTYASSIDIRVGATMDGAVVYYADGSKSNCGIAYQEDFGGDSAEAKSLSEDEVFNITRVSIRTTGAESLDGCRMTLSNGESWGALNWGLAHQLYHLDAGDHERIIGFYGQSEMENGESGYTCQFGIITAPKSVVDSDEGLPLEVYDMPELMNIDGGLELQSS